jgi:hypothetical protein
VKAAPDLVPIPHPRVPAAAAMLPGYRGYKERDLLREDDRAVREHVAARLRRHSEDLRRIPAGHFHGGAEDLAEATARLSAQLCDLADSVVGGAAAFAALFERRAVGRRDLGQVMAVDLETLRTVQELGARMSALTGAAGAPGRYRLVLQGVLPRVEDVRMLLERRSELLK